MSSFARLAASAAVIVASVAGFLIIAWWAQSAHLHASAEVQINRLQHGWQWEFHSNRDLVGGAGTALDARIEDGALVGTASPTGFVSLRFGGEKIDASLLRYLEVEITASAPAELLVFHRETLNGPVLSTRPLPLRAGSQILQVDLAKLDWQATAYDRSGNALSPPEPARWGGESSTVASLRLHPADREIDFRLDAVRIRPKPLQMIPPVLDWSAIAATDSLPRVFVVEVAHLGGRPERVLAARAQMEHQRPAAIWVSTARWPAPPSWLFGVLAALSLVVFLLARRSTPIALLIAWLAAAGWLLGVQEASGTQWAAALGLLALTTVLLWRRAPAPPLSWRTNQAWLKVAGVVVVLALPPLFLGQVNETDWGEFGKRLLVYLPWAFLQQLILQRLLVPACGGHADTPALLVAAALFGLLHFPNFALMTLTLLLGLLAALHFQRHHALLPLAIGHALLGTLYLEWLPRDWLWSGAVGMRYFGG